MAETAAQRPIPRQPADAAIGGLPEDRLRPPPRLSGRNSYSLFVSSMKVLLPALAIGLVLLVVAWPQLLPDVSRSGIDFATIARAQAKQLNILHTPHTAADKNN